MVTEAEILEYVDDHIYAFESLAIEAAKRQDVKFFTLLLGCIRSMHDNAETKNMKIVMKLFEESKLRIKAYCDKFGCDYYDICMEME